jgi:hypothetical protein
MQYSDTQPMQCVPRRSTALLPTIEDFAYHRGRAPPMQDALSQPPMQDWLIYPGTRPAIAGEQPMQYSDTQPMQYVPRRSTALMPTIEDFAYH